jgi:hypothetical protein
METVSEVAELSIRLLYSINIALFHLFVLYVTKLDCAVQIRQMLPS